jgi:CheY-like chemotaxis protein
VLLTALEKSLNAAETFHADIERAVEAGCDDFVSKPVQKRELIAQVQQLLAPRG